MIQWPYNKSKFIEKGTSAVNKSMQCYKFKQNISWSITIIYKLKQLDNTRCNQNKDTILVIDQTTAPIIIQVP